MSERTDERPEDAAEVTVRDNGSIHRYEASTDAGIIAGFAEYVDRNGVRVFTHTEVDDAFEGQGVGSTLARKAIEDVRDRGMELHASCRFIRSYIERHPEFADLQV